MAKCRQLQIIRVLKWSVLLRLWLVSASYFLTVTLIQTSQSPVPFRYRAQYI